MPLVVTFKPEEDESGFGYYRRLATKNSLWGWRELAGLANVSRHRSGLMGRSEHVAAELGLDDEWSKYAKDREEECRRWRGLHRVSSDAICPECFREEPYLRNHWDHAYVTTCPIHRVHLVDHCQACGEMLTANRQHIEQCACGQDLRMLRSTAATSSQIWLSSLLASNGASSAGVQPKLHHVQIANLCELVKILCLCANPTVAPLRRNAANPKSVTEAIELLSPLQSLLAQWPAAFEAHVSLRISAGDAEARTLNKLLGRWYLDLKKTCLDSPLEAFLEAIVRVVTSSPFDGVLGLDTAKSTVSKVSEYVLIMDAAKEIGVSRDRLLKAIKAGECKFRTRRHGTRGLTYEVEKAEVQRIQLVRSEWVSQDDACELAQVSPSVLENMVQAKVISSDVRWRNDILKGQIIEKHSVAGLFETIKQHASKRKTEDDELVTWAELTSRRLGDKQAIQSVMRAAATGELKAVTKGHHMGGISFYRSEVMAYFGTPILEAGMSIQQLAKFSGWKWESISHWMNLGLLESDQIVLRGQPCRVISPQQLFTFQQTYISLATLARSMGTKPSSLVDRLQSVEIVGAKELPGGARRGALIRIEDLGKLALHSPTKGPM
jgi:hypothetical protein